MMHLVQRENLPESGNSDQKRKHKNDHNQDRTANPVSSTSDSPTAATSCCSGCVIL